MSLPPGGDEHLLDEILRVLRAGQQAAAVAVDGTTARVERCSQHGRIVAAEPGFDIGLQRRPRPQQRGVVDGGVGPATLDHEIAR
ncbi:MAG: hypothetical protein KY460_01130 [Actinobacteria bacterium]|nr:hypothetical protein [Actinomycetota bacterium]